MKNHFIDKPKLTDIYITKEISRRQRNEYGELEYVDLEIRQKRKIKPLSLSMRFVNVFCDLLIYQGFLYILNELPPFPFEAFFILISVPIYYILFEFYLQKTPGKYLTQSIVVNEYGESLTFREVLLRTIVRFVPFDALSFFFSSEDRGWHDKWSKTYVINEEELYELKVLLKDPLNIGKDLQNNTPHNSN
ncbi:RDD family protein [Flammeovirga sp. OC4]|uniref:RDD family protein n=1 Tax=Flammeovirga sp. OC4 TaxID=1382345 RepID=UPI0006940369|nr:RDD family protein [Flammeovirga sp. OC4]